MKKIIVTVTLFVSFGFALTAQMIDITGYARIWAESFGFPNWDGNKAPLSINGAAEINAKYGGLGGKSLTEFDTPLELALYSYYEQGYGPEQADAMLPKNNPALAGKKLGAAVLKEMTELRFLDPRNTAAIGRYEGMLQFISEKNGVSRAEIEGFLRQGIAQIVDEKLGRLSFMVDRNYNVILTYPK